jgi:hypothetical protein
VCRTKAHRIEAGLDLAQDPVEGLAVELVLLDDTLGGERGAQEREEEQRGVPLRLSFSCSSLMRITTSTGFRPVSTAAPFKANNPPFLLAFVLLLKV